MTYLSIFFILLPLVLFGFMILYWIYFRRNTKISLTKSIVPQWKIRGKLTPFECGMLVDASIEPRDVAALYIDLAIRGYYSITKEKDDYVFAKLREWDESSGVELMDYERFFLRSIFGQQEKVSFSSVRSDVLESVPGVRALAFGKMVREGYFIRGFNLIRRGLISLGVLIIFFIIIYGEQLITLIEISGLISMVITSLLIIFSSHFFPFHTLKGIKARHTILGLKMFLDKAEKRNFKEMQNPYKQILGIDITFEDSLPYAVALGLEDHWSKQLGDIDLDPDRMLRNSVGDVVGPAKLMLESVKEVVSLSSSSKV